MIVLRRRCADLTVFHYAQICVVHDDMRHYEPKEKADMVISELLGGFGCNELSPECLDASTHKLMKRKCLLLIQVYLSSAQCIVYPSKYTNFLIPFISIPTSVAIERESITGLFSYRDLLFNISCPFELSAFSMNGTLPKRLIDSKSIPTIICPSSNSIIRDVCLFILFLCPTVYSFHFR